jgi:hypothetical protein
MTDINDLITSLGAGDNVKASDVFSGLMQDRINSAMDARKIELGQGAFGEEEQVEMDFEQSEPEIGEEDEVIQPDQSDESE